jgi:Phage Tail Collar Domain
VSEYHPEGIIDVEKRKVDAEHVLGDPTVFPPEFLSWMKRFIEQSGITLPASAIFGNFTAGIGSVRNLAPGLIFPYGGPTPPPGSLNCDGQSVSRTEQAKLFAIIGTTWGSVDANSFNVPDLRGRALYGVGGAVALGAHDAHALATRGASHHHLFGRQNQSLTPGVTAFALLGDGSTVDRNTTGGAPVDSGGWAGVTYVITTG